MPVLILIPPFNPMELLLPLSVMVTKTAIESPTSRRRNKIQNLTSLERYFGKRDSAARLFKLIDASFDKLSFELWFIYHDNPTNPNIFMQYYVEDIESQYNSIFNSIMTSIDKEITHEQEDNVLRTTSVAFDELQDKINRLFFEMSEGICKGNVGNLRKAKHRRQSSR
jgi:hypothetical protein